MLRSGDDTRTLLSTTIQLNLERRRYHYFLSHLHANRAPPFYIPPGYSCVDGAIVRNTYVEGFPTPFDASRSSVVGFVSDQHTMGSHMTLGQPVVHARVTPTVRS